MKKRKKENTNLASNNLQPVLYTVGVFTLLAQRLSAKNQIEFPILKFLFYCFILLYFIHVYVLSCIMFDFTFA